MNMQMPTNSDAHRTQKLAEQTKTFPESTTKHPLEWWYHLTAPENISGVLTLEQRETVRRGRLTSSILLVTALTIIAVTLPCAFLLTLAVLPVLLVQLLLVGIALLFNRKGMVNSAGIIIVTGVDSALIFSLFSMTGGLNPNLLPIYDLLILAEMAALWLLPPSYVFVVAVINSLFILCDFHLQQHAGNMTQMIQLSGPEIYIRPIILHIMIAVVGYLWARSNIQAIKRADHAEVVAALEHNLARQAKIIGEQKRQLELSIQHIIETHIKISKGDLNARVPLTSDNVLWGIAGSLNNLLARLQRLHQLEYELQKIQPRLQRASQIECAFTHTRHDILYVIEAIQLAKTNQRPFRYERAKDTLIHPILAELHSCYLVPSQDIATDKIERVNPLLAYEVAQHKLQGKQNNHNSTPGQ